MNIFDGLIPPFNPFDTNPEVVSEADYMRGVPDNVFGFEPFSVPSAERFIAGGDPIFGRTADSVIINSGGNNSMLIAAVIAVGIGIYLLKK